MARALLAALLLERNRVVSLDRLETLLWDGRPPVRARASLHNHLMRLRRSLGDHSRVRSESGGLVMRAADEELDHVLLARRLEAARRARSATDWEGALREADAALTLWRGAPLTEFPALAHEAAAQVSQWQEAYLQALELRGEAALRLGRFGDQLPELLRLSEEFPHRETFHAQLVQALHRTGRRAEALEVYHRLRRALVDDLGVEPGPAVRLAYQSALGDDEPADEPRAAPDVPNTLPRDVASFTGRGSERERLLAAAEDTARGGGVVGIHAVDGMPGIGKTAFAVHIAHRLKEAFPDGQIYLPLHTHTPGTPSLEPSDALTNLLLALGENPQNIPADLSARAGLWRSHLSGRRMLVLLDDARSSAQVEPLLPGTPGSLVLITSRHRLEALADSTPVTLRVLSEDEASRLLVAKAARDDITADDPAIPALAALCGFLPLALQLIAARLRHRPAWTPADVVRDLEAAHSRLDSLVTEGASVTAAFELSYEDLAPQARAFFRRLGLLLGDDVDVHAAAALSGMPLGRTRALLEELENRHLLEEPSRGRYRMHDLVREYARTLAAADPAAESATATERLLGYYLDATTEADRYLARYGEPETSREEAALRALPAFDGAEEAMAWLRAERANLRAAVEYAAQHEHPTHAIRISVAMTEFHRRSGHWLEALALLRIALDAALVTGDVAGQAMAHRDIATLEGLQGKYEQAEAGLLTALELCRSVRDRHQEASALHNLARIQCLTGRFGEALGILRQALDRFVDVGDRRGQAVIWIDMGQLQQLGGHCDEAIADLEKALELLGDLDEFMRANALTALGDVLKSVGRYADAELRHRQALALFRRLGSVMGQANTLTDLGDVLRLTGAHDEAVDGLREALRLFCEMDSKMGTAQALTFLARVQLGRGEGAEAEAGLLEALGVCDELNSDFARAYVMMHLAEAERARGAYADALAHALNSLELCRQVEDRGGEAEALLVLGGVRLGVGSPGEALECYEQALSLAQEMRLPYGEARAFEGVGVALGGLDRITESRTFLRRALEIDRRLRVPDAERLRALLGED
ncbi:tetratricopeptide repeat protein [Streptomyces sp. NPDC097704]|uniref:AfsR/SARP family transcriptional regulator n=1 Tax=Streptomyces sp. NPDC097704 TaxID=3157101 RepID=UPI0033231779